jgi:hypothetical protein
MAQDDAPIVGGLVVANFRQPMIQREYWQAKHDAIRDPGVPGAPLPFREEMHWLSGLRTNPVSP